MGALSPGPGKGSTRQPIAEPGLRAALGAPRHPSQPTLATLPTTSDRFSEGKEVHHQVPRGLRMGGSRPRGEGGQEPMVRPLPHPQQSRDLLLAEP